ncbi:MAG: O-antigen ligase family protein [Acidimicrobiia bacterium]
MHTRPGTTSAGSPHSAREAAQRGLLAATLFLVPFEVTRIVFEYEGAARGFGRLVTVAIFDVPLFLLLAFGLPDAVRSWRTRRPAGGVGLLAAMTTLFAAALAVHPSLRGVMLVGRLLAAIVVAAVVASLEAREIRRFVVAPVVTAAALQGVVALSQVISGGTIGLPGEVARLVAVGDVVRPAGTTSHPYMLATLALVALAAAVAYGRRTPLWLAGVSLAAIPVGLSFSRAAIVGVGVLAVSWVWGRARLSSAGRTLAVAAAVGMLAPAIAFSSGWAERVEDVTGADGAPSNRTAQFEQAREVIGDHPLVGVGPWLYTVTVERSYPPGATIGSPVHSVPIVAAAEAGVLAGLVMLGGLALLGRQAVRSGPAGIAIFGSILGFMLFDVIPYWYPGGLIVFGLWAGLLDARCHRDGTQIQPATA